MDGGSRPIFKADWLWPVFVHFRIDPSDLQPIVPFELDTYGGDAYLSLVAFTQARLRPVVGGRISELLSTPLACHEFLNLRTYVRHNGSAAIYFVSEWIPNRLAVLIGPRTYGLPYRLGSLKYRIAAPGCRVSGAVRSTTGSFAYRGTFGFPFAPAECGSLDEFLVERYTAFTHQAGISRRFDVGHAPWPVAHAQIEMLDLTLSPIFARAHFALAHVSPGVSDVTISRPIRQISPLRSCTLKACPKPMLIRPN